MDEGVNLRIGLQGGAAAATETQAVGGAIRGLGRDAERATAQGALLGRTYGYATTALEKLGKIALWTGGIATGVLAEGAKKSFEAWEAQRKTAALTGAVLRSTGGTAHVTARDVDSLAAAQSRKTGVDKQVIESGENLLLTFTDIRNEVGKGNDVFDRATLAAQDMAAQMHIGLNSAVKQLGRALQEPTRGIASLRRQGIGLTDTQGALVKALVDSGDKLAAQKIILDAIETKYRGAAQAAATPLDRLRASGKQLEEAIGHGLEPVVDSAADSLDKMVTKATPQLNALDQQLQKTWDNSRLTFAQKLTLTGQDIHKVWAPWEKQFKTDIRNLNLSQDFADAVDYAAPRLLDEAVNLGATFGQSFIRGFLHADVFGKLFALGVIEHKLGAFSKIGALIARGFGGKGGSVVSALTERGSTPANPLFVYSVNGGGLPGGRGLLPTIERDAEEAAKNPAVDAGAGYVTLKSGLPRLVQLGVERGIVGFGAGIGSFALGSGLFGGPFGSSTAGPDVDKPRNIRAGQARTRHARYERENASGDDLMWALEYLTKHPGASTSYGNSVDLIRQALKDSINVQVTVGAHSLATSLVEDPRARLKLAKGVGRAAADEQARKVQAPLSMPIH